MNALPYYGGKSLANHVVKTGPWIASLLPVDRHATYIEPYFGMGGVLLMRPPALVEIVNDINDRLIRWWRVLRDHTDELAHLVVYTPSSRVEYAWAVAHLDGCPEGCNCHLAPIGELHKAFAFHVVLDCGFLRGDSLGKMAWRRCWKPGGKPMAWPYERFASIADRMCEVQIEHGDALALLERATRLPEVIAYVDPPYPNSDTSIYQHGELDQAQLADVLLRMKGRVALSGTQGEWDDLLPGWHCSVMESTRLTPTAGGLVLKTQRQEALYTNYQPPAKLL